jgi:hypothetical protein
VVVSSRASRFGLRAALLVAGVFVLAGITIPANPAVAGPPSPPQMGEFMWGLAREESGADYFIRNGSSGAFGKYQIMLTSWNDWARTYLGDPWADQNPYNQEVVARAKVRSLHAWLGTWRGVAHWWLTGIPDNNPAHWSAAAKRYVRNVMALMSRAPAGGDPIPANRADANGITIHAGDWRIAALRARVWDSPGAGRHLVRWIASDTVLHVQSTQLEGGVLWLQVVLPRGHVAWMKAKWTLPARPPKP